MREGREGHVKRVARKRAHRRESLQHKKHPPAMVGAGGQCREGGTEGHTRAGGRRRPEPLDGAGMCAYVLSFQAPNQGRGYSVADDENMVDTKLDTDCVPLQAVPV